MIGIVRLNAVELIDNFAYAMKKYEKLCAEHIPVLFVDGLDIMVPHYLTPTDFKLLRSVYEESIKDQRLLFEFEKKVCTKKL